MYVPGRTNRDDNNVHNSSITPDIAIYSPLTAANLPAAVHQMANYPEKLSHRFFCWRACCGPWDLFRIKNFSLSRQPRAALANFPDQENVRHRESQQIGYI
jgi:hypothetical protein